MGSGWRVYPDCGARTEWIFDFNDTYLTSTHKGQGVTDRSSFWVFERRKDYYPRRDFDEHVSVASGASCVEVVVITKRYHAE